MFRSHNIPELWKTLVAKWECKVIENILSFFKQLETTDVKACPDTWEEESLPNTCNDPLCADEGLTTSL